MDEAYATIANLRAEGVSEAAVPDGRALDLLRLASRVIDEMTGQWFFPRRQVVTRSGDGSSALHVPSLIPIIDVEHIRIADSYLAPDEYVIHRRHIELRDGRFPAGNANIELAGVFGWLEERAPLETVLAGELAPGATEVDVADARRLLPGDALLVDGRVPLLLSSLRAKTLRFDAAGDGAPAGARVCAYGRVPRPVARACLLIAARNRHGLATEEAAREAVADRIIEERTDNYSYRLAPATEAETPAAKPCCDLSIEQLLADFVAPPFVGFV